MKIFIKGLIVLLIAIFITTTTGLLFNIIKYPLSKQDIINEIESKNIVDSKEEQGAWAYIVDLGNNIYLCHTVSESMFINRYKHYGKFEYNENKDVVSTLVPGKCNFYIMEFDGVSIQFILTKGSRLHSSQIIGFIALNLSIFNLIILTLDTKIFRKLLEKQNQACVDSALSSSEDNII